MQPKLHPSNPPEGPENKTTLKRTGTKSTYRYQKSTLRIANAECSTRQQNLLNHDIYDA